MGKFAKWIGGGLGWAFGGPIGGILGFMAGSLFDSLDVNIIGKPDGKTTMGDFAVSLLVLIAAIMKADGKVLKSELDYVKQFLRQNFGEKESVEALGMLKELLKQNIPVEEVCGQIRRHLDYSSRLQLVHFLFNLANIDGPVTPAEQRLLDIISVNLGVNIKDEQSIGSMFSKGTLDAAYAVLEVDRNATIPEIKKAYRSMAVKYHPDKVAYLGEDVKKAANEKFQKLNEAYELIKKERNFT
ncbi:MAG: TerB family tellurite resistance protein [Bacteroidales bacterium]|jgi:DnaJ like chaperone protein|nr:TerB family tellurite resistance protein [Bacteroidales bacterium]